MLFLANSGYFLQGQSRHCYNVVSNFSCDLPNGTIECISRLLMAFSKPLTANFIALETQLKLEDIMLIQASYWLLGRLSQ